MKLSKLFHTLYATVMALPVLIIPIFALNILHKETEPISIEVQEKVSVDFNQQIEIDSLNTLPQLQYENINGVYHVTNTGSDINSYVEIFRLKNGKSVSGHVYYYPTYFTRQYCNARIWGANSLGDFSNYPNVNKQMQVVNVNNNDLRNLYFIGTFYANETLIFGTDLFDLTQMYGAGNEPTVEEFNQMFPNSYYDYTESQKMLVNKPSPTTYNDTDIGSQFVYALYKPVNDYFNFGEFFGLGGMYDWFQLNIFNGTAPLSFFIVFNVMIYWLFISLFWLLFDILIYVPMVIHKWLDKAEM